MEVVLEVYTPDPEAIIEKAGRTCYKSPEKDAEHRAKFLQGIIRNGHTAVLEHSSATFRITGVSRALTHQLVRHRHFSFCQQSQRYVKENEPQYVSPEFPNEEAKKIYDEFMLNAWNIYSKLVEYGMKKEDARFVLPNAACTEIVVTGNFREWHQFLELRLDSHAQWEIRQLANLLLIKLLEIAPNIFEDLKIKYLEVNKN